MAAPQSQPRPSTSPQWDSRNRGFVTPTQLRQQVSHNDLYNNNNSNPPQQLDMSSTRPQVQTEGKGHTRGASFFSAFRKNSSNNMSDIAIGGGGGGAVGGGGKAATTGPQPGSAGAGGPTVNANESGGMADSKERSPGAELQQQQLQRPSGVPQSIHPEIRSLVQLTIAHSRKVYFSGPLVRRLERQPDGTKPTKDEGWVDVWAQLGGTTLSVWDMKLIAEASKEGREVPPTYINVQDAFVQVLGSVTVQATATTATKRFTDVMTLNTAGSNLLLFACPSTAMLLSWAAALRLSAWEKARLEEIYTAHLLRITIPDVKEAPSQLVKGRLEGWVQIRLAGQTDWKRYYMVVSTSTAHHTTNMSRSNSTSQARSNSPHSPRSPRRLSTLFGGGNSPQSTSPGGVGGPTGPKPTLQLFAGSKPKERRVPLLTMYDINQVFAMYPERPEMVTISTLMKVEGVLGDESVAGGMRNREAWMMIIPDTDGGAAPSLAMLKWVMAFHDTFELYGRPKGYSWDPRDRASLMFGYPVGPYKDLLFLEREAAEAMDPRDDRTSAIRSRLVEVLLEKMRSVPPSLPPVPATSPVTSPAQDNSNQQPQQPQNGPADGSAPSIPSFNFDLRNKGALTPITERTLESVDKYSPQNAKSFAGEQHHAAIAMSHPPPSTVAEETSSEQHPSVLGVPVSRSPQPASAPNSRGPSPVPGSSSKYHGLPNGPASHKAKNSVGLGSPGLQQAPEGAGGAQSQTFRVPSPLRVPVPPVQPQSMASPQPQPQLKTAGTTTSSPPKHLQSPPRSIQASQATSLHAVLTNPHSPPESIRVEMSPQSAASRYSQFSSTDSNAHRVPPSPGHAEPAAPPNAEHASTSYAGGDASRQQPKNLPPISSNIQDPQGKARNPGPFPTTPISGNETAAQGFSDEAGALYYMQQFEGEQSHRATGATEDSHSGATSQAVSPRHDVRLNRQMTDASMMDPTIHGLPNKQSAGARGIPTAHVESPSSPSHHLIAMLDQQQGPGSMNGGGDDQADALAGLSYLAQEMSPTQPVAAAKPLAPPSLKPRDQSPPPVDPEATAPLRSSFAPSKQAAERKARLQAQEAASHAAAHKPGRANGKKKSANGVTGGWHQSSDEEEEEEEDDDDDADSDEERPRAPIAPTPVAPVQPLHPRRDVSPNSPLSLSMDDPNARSQQRQSRTLPPVPGARPGGSEFLYSQGGGRRIPTDQYSESYPRSHYDQSPQFRQQSDAPIPGAAQQNVWSQVLQPGQNPAELNNSNRDTFVQIEPPSQTMTKAFAPQGLLSAGIQDKEDRSAKKQEEIARESGASLINVPNKPPPPQTGLLGAITAHERERKREGGVGAALTEREREKRMAEERQRKLDEFQRQQLEMAQSGAGSMYQQPQFTGYNPMMGNPMMMGMNPMMTGMMGYPPVMPAFANPQQMFAAQQAAAQAYQQAMVTFSQAGSHAGDGGGMAPLNPMMTGGAMSMYNPHMPMMGMPLMGAPYQMGGQPGMTGTQGTQGGYPGIQGGMGTPMQAVNPGMGVQNTGGSGFDARFPPGMDGNGLKAPSPFHPAHDSLGSSSPAGRGSPAADPSGPNPSSHQTSPRPPLP